MLTIVVSRKVSGAEHIELPLQRPILVGDEEATPVEEGQGSQGVVRFIRNESRPGMVKEVEGYFPPIVYVYEATRQMSEYIMSPTEVSEVARVVKRQRVVSYFIPRNLENAALAVGEILHVKKGYRVLNENLSRQGYQAPLFQPVDFDIPRIKVDLREDQWYRRVRRVGNAKSVIISGDSIENDGLYATLDDDSEEREIGITFRGEGVNFRVRIVTEGRIQFLNFRPEHLYTDHQKYGDAWPHILSIIQFFLRYRR